MLVIVEVIVHRTILENLLETLAYRVDACKEPCIVGVQSQSLLAENEYVVMILLRYKSDYTCHKVDRNRVIFRNRGSEKEYIELLI